MRRALMVAVLALLCATGVQAQAPVKADSVQQFVGLLRLREKYQDPVNWTAMEGQAAARHMEYLRQLLADGKLILAGRTPTLDANTLGVIILETKSLDDARAIMRADPLAEAGISTWEVLPFAIFVARSKL